MRVKYQDVFVDGNGRVVSGANVTVYEAGSTTLADIYAASTGGSAIAGSSVTTAVDGTFSFWIDPESYSTIKLYLSKTGYVAATYDDVTVAASGDGIGLTGGTLPVVLRTGDTSFDCGDGFIKTVEVTCLDYDVLIGNITGGQAGYIRVIYAKSAGWGFTSTGYINLKGGGTLIFTSGDLITLVNFDSGAPGGAWFELTRTLY